MKMKKLACLAVAAVMAGTVACSLAACSGDDGLGSDGSVKSINLWAGGSEWTGDNYKNLEKYIKAYNTAKPNGFTVKLSYKPDLETSFQASLTNGKQPDLMIWDRFNTATNSIKNYLEPLADDYIDVESGYFYTRDIIGYEPVEGGEEGEQGAPIYGELRLDDEGTNIKTDFYAPAMQEMMYENKVYGLPIDIDIWGVYVNMDWVKDHDATHGCSTELEPLIKADWTWDDMLTVCKELTAFKEKGVYSGGDQYEHFFKYYVSTGHGDEYLTPLEGDDTGRKYQTNFENDWTKDILEFFQTVYQANVSSNVQEQDSFKTGVCGVMNYTLYHNNYITSGKAPVFNEYKFLPQPKQNTKDGVNGGMIGGYGLACPKPKDNYRKRAWENRHEAALKFMKWMCCNKDNMLKWTQTIGSLPAYLPALEDDECIKTEKGNLNEVLQDARTYATATTEDGKLMYTIRPQVPNYLTLQTDVVNQTVRACITANGANSIANCISELKSSGNQKLLMALN